MSLITALAISIALLGGIATFLYLSPFSPNLQIWAAFLAWGSFFHCGGGESGLKSSMAANLAGVFFGWATLLTLAVIPGGDLLGGVLWVAIVVGVFLFIMVMLANIDLFSSIPGMVYGFAAAAAYSLLTGNTGADALLAPSIPSNTLLCIGLSMIGGALFGYISEKFAGVLKGSEAA